MIGLAAATQGCGKSRGLEKLTGRVTLSNGAPLAGGRVIFHPSETNSDETNYFFGTTDREGSYSARSATNNAGIAAGSYMVTVTENIGNPDHPTPPKINVKYSQVKTSGLQVTVPADGHKYDIVLDPP